MAKNINEGFMIEIKVTSDNFRLVDINEIVLNPKNNNRHDQEQIDHLVKQYEYQGFRDPLIISKRSGFVICGEGRYLAAKKAGMEKLPVIYEDFKDEAQEYAFLTAHNAIASWSNIDLSQVNLDIGDLGPDFDIEMLGIKDFTIDVAEKLEPQCDEDFVPEVKFPITRRGDIWLLGDHRLMCGDSTMIDDVERLMNGERADMVFTDPPYGMSLDADYSKMPISPSGAKPLKHRDILGDDEDFSEDLINTIFTFDNCREMFIFGADYFAELLPYKNDGSWIVWDKRVTENFDRMIGSAFELCWSKNKHKREIARFNNTLYSGEADAKNKIHPTQKPIKLIEWFFDKWCEGLSKCVDLYLGSGSTMIACENKDKACFGMELDEHYCDVIINRWQKYTGKSATLELTGQSYEELKAEREGKTDGNT